ncbi:MAG: HDIG domain-containing protein, partial [Chloroflexota bacterium]
GQVSLEDIQAPRSITYQSEVLTEQEQDSVARQIPLVYSSPDASIMRLQTDLLRDSLSFITTVRLDEFASEEQKMADLAALQNIHLSTESAKQILSLSDSNWQDVQQEATTVLLQIMRTTIREDRLEEARSSIPALVSLTLSEELANLVAELVAAFVAPNSLYSEALTEIRREEAREDVEPITRSFVLNETVVLRGKVITQADLEALQELGLLETGTTWQEGTGSVALILVTFAYIVLYAQHRKDLVENRRKVLIAMGLFIIFLFGARFTIPNRTVIPFLFPLGAYGLLISALVSARAARALVLPLGILAGYGFATSFELTLYYILTSIFGVLVLKNAQRISTFFWAGVSMTIAGAAVILAYRLPDPSADIIGILTLLGAAAFYALSSVSLAILLQYFLAQALGLTTTIQLLELSRPDHPLLQFVLRNAPGTYQHSLQIANLAEQAAELIEADALLTRIGALYHDSGKARHPHFFIENQVPDSHNPHDDLSPLESSQIIVRHVTDGVKMAEKYRLPRRIKDFILEHHGTLITRYQYINAVKKVDGDKSKINTIDFTYPGPRPRSNETALVMLADGCEARTRAERPDTREKLSIIVKEVIDNRLNDGQLDDTELTMNDLRLIADSFVTTLRGIYHPRIEYPKDDTTRPREEPNLELPA